MLTSYASSHIVEKLLVLLDRCGGGLMLGSPGHLYEFENSFQSEAIQVVRSSKQVEYAGCVRWKFLPEKVAL
jgi:hypothetical protein